MATNTIDLVLLSALEKLQIEQNIINRFNGLKPIVVDNYDALNSVVDKNNGFYVTLDTNHWYVYQGGAWVDGGVYQERGIGNGEIVKVNLSQELLDYIASQEWVSGNFATEREAHSLRVEVNALREEIHGALDEAYSLEIENEGVIPEVVEVGGQSYNVVKHTEIVVDSVEGDTVRCENLLNFGDGTWSNGGLDFQISNGTLSINGTPSFNGFACSFEINIPAGTYSVNIFERGVFDGSTVWEFRDVNNNQIAIYGGSKTFTCTSPLTNFRIWVVTNNTFTNYGISPMLVKGEVIPTQFQPYFEGLKHTEYENVTISSPNLFHLGDGTWVNGANFNITSGVLSINGTSQMLGYICSFNVNIPAGTYSVNLFTKGTFSGSTVWEFRDTNNVQYALYGDSKTFTCDAPLIYFRIWTVSGDVFTNYSIRPMLVKGSVIPREYIPYYSYPLLPTPTTLQGVEGFRDTLEARENPITLLYDVYKTTKCATTSFDGTEALSQSGVTWTIALPNANTTSTSVVCSGLKSVSADLVATTEGSCSLANGTLTINIGNHLPREYYSVDNPLVVTYAKSGATEEKLASGLVEEDVFNYVHTKGNVKIAHASEFGAKPKTTVDILYRKVNIV